MSQPSGAGGAVGKPLRAQQRESVLEGDLAGLENEPGASRRQCAARDQRR